MFSGWISFAAALLEAVAVSGHGIPASVKKKLFEPLFTTKKDVGTRLGLWICKSIIETHFGNIRIRSSVAPGRTWTIALETFAKLAPMRVVDAGGSPAASRPLKTQFR